MPSITRPVRASAIFPRRRTSCCPRWKRLRVKPVSIRIILLAAAAMTTLACAVVQDLQSQRAKGDAMQMAADSLPEECRTAAQAGDNGRRTPPMDMQGASPDRRGMTDAQTGYLQSMVKMRGPMQAGIMAQDPDVGFICGMIPH